MKIIHTSDWHIGKIINEFSMIDDQKYILDEFIKLLDNEKPDAIIIAGDIYDRSIPPVEAIELLNDTLIKIVIDRKIKVLAISGNHDSSERLSFVSELLEKNGLYLVGNTYNLFKKVTLKNNDEIVNFYLVPYKNPSSVRNISNDEKIKTHNDAMDYIIKKIKEDINKDEVNIIVCHGYVSNFESFEELETSESERRLSIGGTDLIDVNIFEDFDYVALGHLHKAQKVKRKEVRYSGTLLKYSFSEVNNKKSVTIIDIKNKDINIKLEHLKSLRDMRILEGNIDDILKEGINSTFGRDDYLKVILTDDGEIMNPMEKIRSVYKNTMVINKKRAIKNENKDLISKEFINAKDEFELFKDFYEYLDESKLNDEKEKVLKEIIEFSLREEK